MIDASEVFFGRYVPNIQAVLNPVVLPYLELLNWEDKIVLPQTFFEPLPLLPIKHLKLFRVRVDHQFGVSLRNQSPTYN